MNARPTITIIVAEMIIAERRSPTLFSADDHLTDLQCWSCNGSKEGYIISDHLDILEHLEKIARNGDFVNGIGELSVFNPQTNGAPGVIAGDRVDSESNQFDDVQTVFNRADNFFRR